MQRAEFFRRGAAAAPALLAALVGGCDVDGLVDLRNPDLITVDVVQDTANLPTLRNGVLFEFAQAYAGFPSNNSQIADAGQIVFSGLLADELWNSSTFTSHQDIDARDVQETNGSNLLAFRFLQRARALAEATSDLYGESSRSNTVDHALVTSLAGFTYVLFAENYCSGVPISRQPISGSTEYGPPLPTDSLLERALARFDQAAAIAQAAGSAQQLNLARVGRARALQDLGRFGEAAAAAAGVPDDFGFAAEYSAGPTGNNGVWYWINSVRRFSAASGEGSNGIRFFDRGPGNATLDPRAPADSVGGGLSGNANQYAQLRYPERESSIPLATGLEARLIAAEALLDRGRSAAYLATLNELRAEEGLPALADPGTPRARILQLYEERAFWLWLTSHRLGDLRRLVRHYGFQPNEVFPTGATVFGVPYGTDTSLPIPFDETNNPEFRGGCLSADT